MTTLLGLLATPPFDYDKGQYIYAQTIVGRFAKYSQAALANVPPPDMELFDHVDHADSFIEAVIMEGDPDQEIASLEWKMAAERLIEHVNEARGPVS